EEALAVGSAVRQSAAHPAGDVLGVSTESVGAGDSAHATSPFEGDGCRPWSGRSTQGCGERGLPSASRARADQVRPPEPINGSGCAETGAACDSEPAALEDQLVPLDTHFEVVQRG